MSEGDLRLQLLPTAEPLDCTMDQIAEDEILDPDFKAFLEHQFVTPRPTTPLDLQCHASSTPFSFDAQHDFVYQPKCTTAALQQYGLLRSPGTTQMRKRKYGLLTDTPEMARSLPSQLSQDFQDVTSAALGFGCNMSHHGPIRTCKVNTNVLTELKQSNSPGLGCAMPFSLVKKYPSSDSLSLEDINNRIQKLASNPEARTPTNSGTSNSTQLTQPSPPTVTRRGGRKR